MAKFDAAFKAAYPNLPIDYLGQKTEPVGGKLVKFRVVRAPKGGASSSTYQRGLGNTNGQKPMRNLGSVLIVLTFPTGQGSGEILEVADVCSGIWHGFLEDGVRTKAGSLTGPVEVDTFLQATVDAPYQSDYYA